MVTCAKQYVMLKSILYCHLDFTDSNDSSSAGSSLPQQTEMRGVMWVRIFNRLFMIIVGSASSNKLCCYQVQCCLSCVAAAGHLCVFKQPSDGFAAVCQICKQCPTLPFVVYGSQIWSWPLSLKMQKKKSCRIGQLVRINTCVTWDQSFMYLNL